MMCVVVHRVEVLKHVTEGRTYVLVPNQIVVVLRDVEPCSHVNHTTNYKEVYKNGRRPNVYVTILVGSKMYDVNVVWFKYFERIDL